MAYKFNSGDYVKVVQEFEGEDSKVPVSALGHISLIERMQDWVFYHVIFRDYGQFVFADEDAEELLEVITLEEYKTLLSICIAAKDNLLERY